MTVFEAPCKAGDGKTVTYDPNKPEKVWGTETVASQDVDVAYETGGTKTVYLTCPLGHVYPYDVPV